MDKNEQLMQLLETMDVPSLRMNDLRWLSRNLGMRNRRHPQFLEAIKLIRLLLKEEDTYSNESIR